MLVKEIIQPFDYNFPAWREMQLTRTVSDLVINGVCPSFSLYDNWSYVEGTSEDFYENDSMHDRFSRSIISDDVVDSIRSARRGLGDEKMASLQSFATAELSSRLYDDIEYAQGSLMLSNVSMINVMQHVGFSLYSTPIYINNYATDPTHSYWFSSPDIAAGHIFEYVYAAHCMHTRVGIIHGDLHANNMTYLFWGSVGRFDYTDKFTRLKTRYYENPLKVFIAGERGQEDSFVFPSMAGTGYIIDFSRSIIGPAFRDRLVEEHSEEYAELFYRDQVNRILRLAHRYSPDLVLANQTVLKAIALAHFDALFQVLALTDFVAVARSVIATLERPMGERRNPNPEVVFRPCPEAIHIARKLEDVAILAFTDGLKRLIAGKLPGGATQDKHKTEKPFATGLDILKGAFSKWQYENWSETKLKNATVVDVFNHNNEVKHSGSDYNRFPPWARIDLLEPHLGEYTWQDMFAREGPEEYFASQSEDPRVDVIAVRERDRQASLDAGAPPLTPTSSWIEG
jgi:hypothetical protein